MDIYVGGRQSGKTALLIKKSADTRATIAVPTYRIAQHIKEKAQDMHVDIPEPVTFTQVLRSYQRNESKRYLIDELQTVLDLLNVDCATVNKEAVKPIPNHRGNRAKIYIIDEL